MTAPKASHWPLTPSLRLAGLALLFAAAAFLVEGWANVVLRVCAVVFLVLAAAKFAKVWRSRR
jgi:hypothetical protein